jgi:hypothetical protein
MINSEGLADRYNYDNHNKLQDRKLMDLFTLKSRMVQVMYVRARIIG